MHIHHVQLTAPEGCEKRAREFYSGLLEMVETSKPPTLSSRGLWFRTPEVNLHIGVSSTHQASDKAHVALYVSNLEEMRSRLESGGFPTSDAVPFFRFQRFFSRDPFGNRIEFIGASDRIFVYRVSCTFTDRSVAHRWRQWLLEEHLNEVIEAGAMSAQLTELSGPAICLEARYLFVNEQAFAAYQAEHGPRLRTEGLARFPLSLGLTYARTTGWICS